MLSNTFSPENSNILALNKFDPGYFSKAIAEIIKDFTGLRGPERVSAAVFIQCLKFSSDKLKGTMHKGKKFIYLTYEYIRDKFLPSFNDDELRNIICPLEEIGVIEREQLNKKKYDRTYYYWINLDWIISKMRSLEEAETSQNPNIGNPDHRILEIPIIEDRKSQPSYTKRSSIEDLTKKNINTTISENENLPENKNQNQQEMNSDQEINNSPSLDKKMQEESNLNQEINLSEVEKECSGAAAIAGKKPKHFPQGDKFFGGKNYQQDRRAIAKKSSSVGMNRFKDAEDLNACQIELTVFYATQLTALRASEKAKWDIKAATDKGVHNVYIEEYLSGKKIGSSLLNPWEISPNKCVPGFFEYLVFNFKDGKEVNHVKAVDKASWQLKNIPACAIHYAEFKRVLVGYKTKIKKAIATGVSPSSLKLPDWVQNAAAVETPDEEASEVMGALTNLSLHQEEVIQQTRAEISGTAHILPSNSAVTEIPTYTPKQILEAQPGEPKSEQERLNQELSDPITREAASAKITGEELVLDDLGEPVAVVSNAPSEPRGKAYQVFKAEKETFDKEAALKRLRELRAKKGF